MPDSPTELFRNAARRPVEIHLGETLTVLLPGETVKLAADDPHCAALEQRGVLTRVPPPAATVPPLLPRAKTTNKTTAKKTTAKKTTAKKSTPMRASPEEGGRS